MQKNLHCVYTIAYLCTNKNAIAPHLLTSYAMSKLSLQVTKITVRSEYPLPTFRTRPDRRPYAKYCPSIEAIERAYSATFENVYSVELFTDDIATLDEVEAELCALAAFYAQECDSPEFDNAENLTPCA